jgi:phosphatidylglycerophosphate synthase
MKWKEFNKLADKEFTTLGSTWYHMTVTFHGTKVIAFFANNIGLSPNLVSLFSSLFAVTAMGLILWKPNDLGAKLLSLLLLQLCFMSDLADGMVARIQKKTSRFGAFLDVFLDRFNSFIVFAGFGFAWVMNSSTKTSLISIAIYISAASAYILYTIAAMQRGFIFPDLKGAMEGFGKTWSEKVVKFPYQFINMGVHFLLLSLSYIVGLIYPMVIFYGILGGSMTIAMIGYLYFKDAAKGNDIFHRSSK